MKNSSEYNHLVHLFEIQSEWEVVAYYPYTSIVTLRIYESNNWGEETTDAGIYSQKLFEKYMQEAENLDCQRDNKVVIELKPKHRNPRPNFYRKESSIFIGRYDGKVCIGFGVCIPEDSEYTKKYIKNRKVKDSETGNYKLIHDNFTLL